MMLLRIFRKYTYNRAPDKISRMSSRSG